MIRPLLLALTVVIGTAASAFAQTGDTYNQQLFAPSYAVNNTSSVPASSSSTSTNRNTDITRYQGSYTLHNVPDMQAPSIVGGNPCSVGMSGGVAFAGFGLTAGATYADKGCERRNVAAILFNMGHADAGLAVMCQDPEVRRAMLDLGQPCIQDRGRGQAPPAPATPPAVQLPPQAQQASPVPDIAVGRLSPAAPTRTQNYAAGPAVSHVASRHPAWCARARPQNEAEQTYLQGVCGPGGFATAAAGR